MSELLTFFRKISADPSVRILLGPIEWIFNPSSWTEINRESISIVGWGYKKSTFIPRFIAKKLDIPFIQLEDGLISYLGHPSLGDRRFSLISDRSGIYYNAGKFSYFDQLMSQGQITNSQRYRVNLLIKALCENSISKYNHQLLSKNKQVIEYLGVEGKEVILVVDQTKGDASVLGALSTEESFQRMLTAAINDNSEATIIIKVHPDTLVGKKKGYFTDAVLSKAEEMGAIIIANQVSAGQLIGYVDKVYTVSSQIGFEALLHKKEVHCYGMPFYAGYGLTVDEIEPLLKRQKSDIETLAHRMLLEYCLYIDPETLQPCELEDLLPLLAEQTKARFDFNRIHAVDFSFWKRCFLRSWFRKNGVVIFHRSLELAEKECSDDDVLLLWGKKYPRAKAKNIIRVEDGFIRSAGLGVDLNAPLSLVFDQNGIYFDAQISSDLEELLLYREVVDEELLRGKTIRQKLITHSVNKYNLSGGEARNYLEAGNRKIILVPGQVDSDASIQYGSCSIKSSYELLQSVRNDFPDAYIVYRPHPDVMTGQREGMLNEVAKTLADTVEVDGSILDSINACDEVHCLTSLAGFEALIRNKKVVCYGLPFYAGWGLTVDKFSCSRRTRTRSLDELVFICVAVYPDYIHPVTKRYTTVERIIDYLADLEVDSVGLTSFERLRLKAQLLIKTTLNQ